MDKPVTNAFFRPAAEFTIDEIPYWDEAFTEARAAEDPHWRLTLMCAAPSLAEAPYLASASLPLCSGGFLPVDDNQKTSCRPSCGQADPTTVQRLWRENRLDYDSIARIPVRDIRRPIGQDPIEESVIRFALVKSDIHHPIPSLCTGVQAHTFLPVPLTRPEALTAKAYTRLNSYNFSRCGPAVGSPAVGSSAVGTHSDEGEYVVDYGKVRGGRAALIADLDALIESNRVPPPISVKLQDLHKKLYRTHIWDTYLKPPLLGLGFALSLIGGGFGFFAGGHIWERLTARWSGKKVVPPLHRSDHHDDPPSSRTGGGSETIDLTLNKEEGTYEAVEAAQRMLAVGAMAALAVAAAKFALRAAPVPALASLAVVGLGIYAHGGARNYVK